MSSKTINNVFDFIRILTYLNRSAWAALRIAESKIVLTFGFTYSLEEEDKFGIYSSYSIHSANLGWINSVLRCCRWIVEVAMNRSEIHIWYIWEIQSFVPLLSQIHNVKLLTWEPQRKTESERIISTKKADEFVWIKYKTDWWPIWSWGLANMLLMFHWRLISSINPDQELGWARSQTGPGLGLHAPPDKWHKSQTKQTFRARASNTNMLLYSSQDLFLLY